MGILPKCGFVNFQEIYMDHPSHFNFAEDIYLIYLTKKTKKCQRISMPLPCD